jgi:hypothetical protein
MDPGQRAQEIEAAVKAHDARKRSDEDDEHHDRRRGDGRDDADLKSLLRALLQRLGNDGDDDPEYEHDDKGRLKLDAKGRRIRRVAHDDDDSDPNPRPGEPERMASDDRRSRKEDDDDDNRRADAQYQFDQVYQAVRGERAPPPMVLEGSRHYRLRMLNPLRQYSADYKDIDLSKITDPALFDLADRKIRADAYEVGCNPHLLQSLAPLPRLREIRKQDQSGRWLSEFVGPVSETLAPFRLPVFRVKRINTHPDRD